MRPKKTWVLTQTEVDAALRKSYVNEASPELPRYYVRVMVDGQAYYVAAFKEADWEKIQ